MYNYSLLCLNNVIYMHMFSSLIIWYWIANYFFPEENYFPCTQHSVVTVVTRTEAL